jgi:hypothetical protein
VDHVEIRGGTGSAVSVGCVSRVKPSSECSGVDFLLQTYGVEC